MTPTNMINATNLNTFSTAYEKHLIKAMTDHPAEYGLPASHAPVIAAKMKKAFENGSYNKDGRAIKATCKELNIPYTYAGINGYLHQPAA